jgi:hypothetical protein
MFQHSRVVAETLWSGSIIDDLAGIKGVRRCRRDRDRHRSLPGADEADWGNIGEILKRNR